MTVPPKWLPDLLLGLVIGTWAWGTVAFVILAAPN